VKRIKGLLLRIYALLLRDDSPKVVFYHDIGKKWTPMGTDVDVFSEHVNLLRNGDVVCLDDGFRGVWDVREQLAVSSQRLGVKVIVSLAVGLVGKPGCLTWGEIRELQNKDGVEFQCHMWSL